MSFVTAKTKAKYRGPSTPHIAKCAMRSAQDDELVGWCGEEDRDDEGFLLLGALVLIFLVLLALTVAAPRIARGLQREKEVESERRANQYVRAIRMYYKKFGHYPGSVEQLEKTNNQRFLRQRYIDPLTGKSDWRLIHVGENQTKVKGFFGQELQGLQAGLGSAAGMASPMGGSAAGTGGSAFGNSGAGAGVNGMSPTNGGAPGTFGGTTVGAIGPSGGAGGGTGSSPGAGLGSGGAVGMGSTGIGSQSVTDLAGTGGPIMGIGSAKSGEAMLVVNEQTTYETWEFLYDPRIEQLYAKANLLGGVSTGSATGTGVGTPVGTPLGGTPPGPGTGTGTGLGTGSGTPTTPPQ